MCIYTWIPTVGSLNTETVGNINHSYGLPRHVWEDAELLDLPSKLEIRLRMKPWHVEWNSIIYKTRV